MTETNPQDGRQCGPEADDKGEQEVEDSEAIADITRGHPIPRATSTHEIDAQICQEARQARHRQTEDRDPSPGRAKHAGSGSRQDDKAKGLPCDPAWWNQRATGSNSMGKGLRTG
ncbi:hypothetical protein CH63R_14443 [Colletotrichum higginsianum IMI 349063]|uniref:Uncharacterized protein n=1 Tax=Colletotrichum higginsianum (strain IMI 349063) TaxID=759273 RepID=A0A1B7XQU6_COLHI|nr:hypothetical protein CH63R_14443 [Colletotrichum higginsianum IMI 349063]OBR02142.1 hypothetical protein CH63R_14443 [Colletotrichum higginsianum IMI 349063]